MSQEAMITLDPRCFEQLRALDRKLLSLEKGEAKKAANYGLRRGAAILKKAASANAPVGKDYKRSFKPKTTFNYVKGKLVRNPTTFDHAGGTLKSKGFQVGRGRFGDKNTASVLLKLAKRDRMGIPRSYKWYYPAIVEYGVKKGSRQFAGSGFMRRAFRSNGDAAIKATVAGAWLKIERLMTARGA